MVFKIFNLLPSLQVFSQSADDNLFGLKFKASASVLYMSNESDQIVQAVTHLKKRWLMSQPVRTEWSVSCVSVCRG